MFAQRTDGRTDRILARRAAGDIRVRAMKGKVSLIELTDQLPVLQEEMPAFLHICLCFFDLVLLKQLVRRDARLVHFGAEIEGRWGFESVRSRESVVKREHAEGIAG